ncbi:MAG TPA: DUF1343 domain-containing protein [Chloroflexia bacterium]|nr:DUF1343 domain-containing protein [Chloroflexia bacterium]
MSVRSGLDVLAGGKAGQLNGKKVGLVTNQTGIDRKFRRTAQVLHEAGATVCAMFGPEHGYYGVEQDAIALTGEERDRWNNVAVYSLYRAEDLNQPDDKETNPFGPPPGSLDGLDALVFDIQDVGVRYYTYPTTLGILLEQVNIPVYVIDRPNPLGGTLVEGPGLEAPFSSFVGRYPGIPVRHGLTIGELALYINRHILHNRAEVTVIQMEGWRREMAWEETGLPWVATSPNLPTLTTARLYPGTCLVEGTNLSLGRGTTQPFELVGAPWITDPDELAAALNRLERPGIYFRPTFFKPIYFPYKEEVCGGVQIHILPDVSALGPEQMVRSGLLLVATLFRLYSEKFKWLPAHFDRLIGSAKPRLQLEKAEGNATSLQHLFDQWEDDEQGFKSQIDDVLLYK